MHGVLLVEVANEPLLPPCVFILPVTFPGFLHCVRLSFAMRNQLRQEGVASRSKAGACCFRSL